MALEKDHRENGEPDLVADVSAPRGGREQRHLLRISMDNSVRLQCQQYMKTSDNSAEAVLAFLHLFK